MMIPESRVLKGEDIRGCHWAEIKSFRVPFSIKIEAHEFKQLFTLFDQRNTTEAVLCLFQGWSLRT